jgi:four helix bundle protein
MESGNDKNNTFFRFEDLRIYHKALNYARWVQESTSSLAENDSSGTIDRFNRSSQNIALNIAEGSARNKSQFIYYLKMSKSAVRECLVYTSLVYKLEWFSDEEEEGSRNQLMEMTKMIGALIASLQRGNNKRDDEQEAYEATEEMPDD